MLRLSWLALLILALDQLTKWLAVSYLATGPVALLPFFDLELAYNTGAAFGFLNSAGGWQRWFFVGIAAVVSVVIVATVRRLKQGELQLAVALLLVLGGAIGNVIDRIRLGKVVDFLHFFVGQWEWPNFNVADSAICIGAALLILDAFHVKLVRARGTGRGSRTGAGNSTESNS